MTRREPRPPAGLPAKLVDAEKAAMMKYAREKLAAVRASPKGDPFDPGTRHQDARAMLKTVAERGERNANFVADMARDGFEDAHEAVADLISDRNARSEPLGYALSAYVATLAQSGPPRVRRPHERPLANPLANFVIVCLIADLMQQFPTLKLTRSREATKGQSSACSIVSAVLDESRPVIGRGSPESILAIWKQHERLIDAFRRAPPPGVVRFMSREI